MSGECRTCGYDEANHRREAHLYDPHATAVDVDALAKLREAATAGPWEVIDWDNFEGIAIGPPEGYSETPVVAVDVGVVRADDAALIVAAVNALEPLIAEVRRGRARDEVLAKLIATAPVVWNGDYPVKAVPVSDLLSLDALAVLAAVDGGER